MTQSIVISRPFSYGPSWHERRRIDGKGWRLLLILLLVWVASVLILKLKLLLLMVRERSLSTVKIVRDNRAVKIVGNERSS
jgi:hypothetical protein